MYLHWERSGSPWALLRQLCLRSAGWRASCRSTRSCQTRRQVCVLWLNRPAHSMAWKECRDMTTERSPRFPAFRIVVMLVVLVNLILTIAVIMQVRELQQRVASLPPDLASKRDVAMLRPLRVREILTQNCVECHSSRQLGVTVAMEPAEIQRTFERMQTHPGANISPGEFERIAASLLVVRCARCHGEETLNLMVLKPQPERLATIRRMAALPGSGVRPDQVLAIAQAFEKLMGDGDRDGASKNTDVPAMQPRR